jgi:hypothetical protein
VDSVRFGCVRIRDALFGPILKEKMLLVYTSRLSRLVPRIHQLRILGAKLLLCQMLDQRARRQHAIPDLTHALKTPVHSPEQRQICLSLCLPL